MKIGIILDPYGEKQPAGLGRALMDLVRAMIASAPGDEFLIFTKGTAPARPEFPGHNWSHHTLGGGLFWRDRGIARSPRADAYLYYTPIMPMFVIPGKSVVIALDFAYLAMPARGLGERIQKYFLRFRHALALRRAGMVIAISTATKKDTVRFFGIAEDKIRVVPLGFNPVCDMPEATVDTPEKFFLFVGVMKERKNVRAIIKAFEKFSSRHPDYHLLLAGKAEGEYADRLRREAAQGSARDRIRFLGYRSDGEIAYLYRRAVALVYPSIIEGFGLPILEAMACGTAVITSRASSLAEISGDAALLVNPENTQEIADAMERIASHPEVRNELIRNGHEQTKKFSWEKAGKEMLAVFRRAV
ncbi:MAG: glycosyltransferase family 4 protein [Candidatus Sungbacteria bacterium]|nr:glycosyltransferase family 4 protein [Candidatus Sungbacteria bacterium]